MNLARWLVAAAVTALSACAQRVLVPEVRLDNLEQRRADALKEQTPRVEIVEVPTPLPLPGQLKPLPRKDAADLKKNVPDVDTPAERIGAANKSAKVEPSKAGYINAIQVYPYVKGALYQLYAAVNQVTDVALESGEKLVSVSAGDTVRWVVGDTTSGEGKDVQVHILVKPIGADLQTNLVITTDRRTYHLEMRYSPRPTWRQCRGRTRPRSCWLSRSSAAKPTSPPGRSPMPASTSSSSSSAIRWRAMHPGGRCVCSTTAPRSTSSSRQV